MERKKYTCKDCKKEVEEVTRALTDSGLCTKCFTSKTVRDMNTVLKTKKTVVKTEEIEATVSKEIATVPTETATVPTETATVSKETATVPTETVTVPIETATVPIETATMHIETSTVPTEIVTENTPTNPAFTPSSGSGISIKQRPYHAHILGKRIKEARILKNLRQSDVAEKINVSKSTIVRIESGAKMPDVETLAKIAKVLDILPD